MHPAEAGCYCCKAISLLIFERSLPSEISNEAGGKKQTSAPYSRRVGRSIRIYRHASLAVLSGKKMEQVFLEPSCSGTGRPTVWIGIIKDKLIVLCDKPNVSVDGREWWMLLTLTLERHLMWSLRGCLYKLEIDDLDRWSARWTENQLDCSAQIAEAKSSRW